MKHPRFWRYIHVKLYIYEAAERSSSERNAFINITVSFRNRYVLWHRNNIYIKFVFVFSTHKRFSRMKCCLPKKNPSFRYVFNYSSKVSYSFGNKRFPSHTHQYKFDACHFESIWLLLIFAHVVLPILTPSTYRQLLLINSHYRRCVQLKMLTLMFTSR